ncbi:Ribosomal large subunit pseudouridine synthase D [Jeotgalicoccus saudimassiliensis]|uniref:Pseudouridine synthase n=1 Tax=Jeotgalicoccus saudimassiliensis TaxID=1461582 RepID=A0A078M872_9STAP|nr:RluA family pseudouridine synthase [Jeotgalicoccus saudimassiliensis]CEA02484.1 Ribosomal large subunit pseudouridine synthase D [Jeotgalicoccus saudimassiliensis]
MKKKPTKKPNRPRHEEWTVKEHTEVLEFLFKVMPSKSRNAVKGILKRGQVVVNDKPTTQFDDKLKPGDFVQIRERVASASVKLKGVTILHEDDDVIVVDKESGLLSMGSKQERQMTAYKQLMDYVQSIHPKNRIFIVHRLDRDTSGVMIFARSKIVQQKLQKAWTEAVQERSYVALVEGVVSKGGTITSWLTEDRTFMMHSSPKPNHGQKAITHYKVMKSNRRFSLLKVNLDTGRKNQIRVHMQDLGHPIVGDKKYGSEVNTINRLGLHANAIKFKHPSSGKMMRFESETPASFTRGFK